MHRGSWLVCVALLAGCSSDAPGVDAAAPDAPPAADVQPTPDTCETHHDRTCHEGDVYWVDSCGQREELLQACAADTICRSGWCCAPAQGSGALELPAHTIHVKWTLAGARLEQVSFTVRIVDDPGEQVGLYLGLFNGTIDKTMFYLGIQTDLYKPGEGGVGRGLIFSRWATQDPADTRPATGGFVEIGTHEGYFVGVRRPYPWKPGDYTVTLARGTQEGKADWYVLSITDDQGNTTDCGGLRFLRSDPATPAAIADQGTTFTEVYSHAADLSEVPAWHTAVMAAGDGAAPAAATMSYPAWPHAEFPNADAYLDSADGLVHMVFGGDTPRCHPAGPLLP